MTEHLRSDPTDRPAVRAFERHRQELRAKRRRGAILFWAILLVAVAVSVNVAQFFPQRLLAGLPRVGDYLFATLPELRPDVLFEGTRTEGSLAYWYFNLPKYLLLLAETINMALIGTALGTTGALILCFPASHNLVRSTWIYTATRRLLEFCRAVPEIIFAILFVYTFGVGPLAGVLALAIHTAGALGKLFSEVNENVPAGPIEGVRGAGGSWLQEMRFAVLPQVLPNFLSYALLRFEINIRSSSILGFVGAGGIGQELYYVISFNHYEEVSAIVLLIVLTVTSIDLLSARLRQMAAGQEQFL
ncbi:phosphonate ABC transporter, permease protein PhnE [Geminicoccus flavidas]|uniref:phosphonate ABC transporter, permease protein PhnE n=1 Tax=Geminicoccus flavidas TaxID=2506407 RepID=UPI001359E8DC|nr:phosphonate ABC transporter, permease protein PhnE [Geminicoccus flavidas]